MSFAKFLSENRSTFPPFSFLSSEENLFLEKSTKVSTANSALTQFSLSLVSSDLLAFCLPYLLKMGNNYVLYLY